MLMSMCYLSNSGKIIDFVSFSYKPNTSVFKEPRFFSSAILCYHGHTDQNEEIGRMKTYGHAALKRVLFNALTSNYTTLRIYMCRGNNRRDLNIVIIKKILYTSALHCLLLVLEGRVCTPVICPPK